MKAQINVIQPLLFYGLLIFLVLGICTHFPILDNTDNNCHLCRNAIPSLLTQTTKSNMTLQMRQVLCELLLTYYNLKNKLNSTKYCFIFFNAVILNCEMPQL